jgi:hypothetical protein
MPAAKRITDLTAYTQALGTDVLAIVDITTNTTKKILVSDFLKSGGGIVKVTKLFSDWQPSAGAQNTIVIFSIPPGAQVASIKTKHSISFSGGTTASAVVNITDANALVYNTSINVFQAPSNTRGGFSNGISSDTLINDHGVASNLSSRLTITGDIINNLVAGSVDFFIEVKIYK